MDMRTQISKQTTFALSLTRHLSSTLASDRNLAFSPASLHVILALIAAGAKGPTLDQILHFLRSDGAGELASLASEVVGVVLADVADGGGPMVRFANGVWVDSSVGLKPSFKEVVGTGFQAEAKGVDFQAKAVEVANEVNSWVENVSAGLIKELLPSGSVNSNTRLVFANALYFKGAWEQKFDPSKTKESDFFLLDGTLVKVQFMTSKEKQFLSSYDGFSVLRLPYKQGNDKRQFSMYIFLPHAKDGLWNLSEKLSSESEFLDRHLPRQKVSVGKFKIPKFKISFGFEATEVLKGLGLALPFSQDGDLTEMVDDSAVGRNLFVSSIFHKSFIEVNEEGTEAAAATAAVVMMRSFQLSTPDFEADHPFAFVIREDMTGVVMFTGHILNPLLSE